MIFNYDKENGITFLKNYKKQITEIPKEAEKVFSICQKVMTPESISEGLIDWDTFIEKHNVADDSLKNFLKDTNYAEKTLPNYKKYLESAGSATSKFSSSLKNLGGTLLSTFANMAIMYAAGAAIQFVGTKIYEYVKATEIAIEKGEKAQNAIKEVYDTYNSKVSTVNTNKNVFKHCTNCIKLIRLIECLIIL